MTKKEISRIFESFNSLKILILGDVMIDSYVWGKVTRISPEAPVPVVAVSKKENRLGGAANVALNIQAMQATPVLCAVVGDDDNANVFLDLLKKQNLSSIGILKSKKRPTTVKTRVIGNNHQLLRVDEEVETEISKSEADKMFSIISSIISKQKIDAIAFEDYDKGLITKELIENVMKLASSKKIPTVVDPKKNNFLNYKGVTLFKPNLKEFKEGLKIDFDQSKFSELQSNVSNFRVRQNIDSVLLTLSEYGVYIQDKKNGVLIPAHHRDIADVSGAGDTVIGVAALCVALGLPNNVIAAISNLAGGLVCEYVGVVPINKQQLLEETLKIKFN